MKEYTFEVYFFFNLKLKVKRSCVSQTEEETRQ